MQDWNSAFLQSSVVDQETQFIKHQIALQLYKGRNSTEYPLHWPQNLEESLVQCKSLNSLQTAERIVPFLNFIGTSIKTSAIHNYLEKNKGNKAKLLKKVGQIFKTLAYLNETKSVLYIFQECDAEWYYLLQIDQTSGNSAPSAGMQEESDLPKLYSLPINLPDGYENDPLVNDLFNKLENSNQHFFITGKAGTGKSTFIHYFCSKSKKKILKTAFTGIAAVNIGGETLHSLFYFPFKPLLPDDDDIITFQENTFKKKLLEQFDVLIIDEVSMLRSDLLQAVDTSLRRNTGVFDKAFGGKQIILVGDVFQLPPVVENDLELRDFFSDAFESQYFFDAPAFKTNSFTVAHLTKIHRQGNETAFIELLNKIRACNLDDVALINLNKRFKPDYSFDQKEFIIYLTTTNALARLVNNEELVSCQFDNVC